ncbi:hypothetical protein BDV25DRAFT_152474 [Aspergillus avenaceus]|uniref:Uncharacterized protein n=1 Tax=Aspergillus avenaceus TaxID=36643 RepID=A0A5N6TZ85_ASPAV|nr:hypothetical protein BDV25DRAFT_152474 [Aspergillus avenaceus]
MSYLLRLYFSSAWTVCLFIFGNVNRSDIPAYSLRIYYFSTVSVSTPPVGVQRDSGGKSERCNAQERFLINTCTVVPMKEPNCIEL